jgi:hypothetical protein
MTVPYAFPFSPQVSPFLQSQPHMTFGYPQQIPFGFGGISQPFGQPSQYALPQQQVIQAIAQQLLHLNQQNQQQLQLLHQLIQAVPYQLQQIQQFLQILPQVIHQQSAQIHPQPYAQGIGGIGSWPQQFAGGSPWSGASIPQHASPVGQPGIGANFGFPSVGGQPGSVM